MLIYTYGVMNFECKFYSDLILRFNSVSCSEDLFITAIRLIGINGSIKQPHKVPVGLSKIR